MENQRTFYKIAIIGGTGREGKGLAYRWANFGHEIIIGSRNIQKADSTVVELKSIISNPVTITAMENTEAIKASEIIVLTVPFSAHEHMLESLKPHLTGKLLIDVTVPINPNKPSRVWVPEDGSAGKQAVRILGENTKVVVAFQNVSFNNLLDSEYNDCDVLVCGTGKEARNLVIKLVEDAGFKGWDAGTIDNAMVVEGMTAILIGLNAQHKVHTAGIKITGINE